MTLIELLMVISILTVLLAVSIPMIRPAFQDRNLREAARQVNIFFAGAKARAAEQGRPVGVWIERFDPTTELGTRHATRLYMAEVAASFTGASLDSRATVTPTGIVGTLNLPAADDMILRTIIAPGEKFTIKFDHKGFDYFGLRQAAGPFEIQIPLGVPAGAAATGPGLTYEITRGPTRSSVSPLTLPGDSVIDLSLSGTGTTGREMDSAAVAPWVATPIIIMFAPTGRVDYVYLAGKAFQPFAPLHLLIGRKAKVVNPLTTDVANPQTTNLGDPTSLWITISERTGSILTSDNADTSFVPPATPPPPFDPSVRLKAAREFARSSVQKGGR
jgi:type II secretory pathway pseudopilin PulG